MVLPELIRDLHASIDAGRDVAELLRLLVCRGESASKVARALAGELALLAETYERCATLPEAAEREPLCVNILGDGCSTRIY